MTPPPLVPSPGDPIPQFRARTATNPMFEFHTVAGRYVVLCFFGSAGHERPRAMVEALLSLRQRFDDDEACLFGITVDPDDERLRRVADAIPGIRFFWDFDRKISAQFGACEPAGEGRVLTYRPYTLVLDPRLRVVGVIPLDESGRHAERVAAILDAQPPVGTAAPARLQAPVLQISQVFEPELCRRLIAYFEAQGSEDSGFMRDIDGRTTSVTDHAFKRRRDCRIDDAEMRRELMVRIHRRIAPELLLACNFKATRMERYIIACYDASTGGFFRPHRDNTTMGTAHRRFAVTINLNAEEYEGGDLRFPEYGRLTYRAASGGAVVFSCAMLHEALPVTAGRRLAFLPFLYDEDAARLRETNNPFLAPGVGDYVAGDRRIDEAGP